jgi:hypothetical protein
MVWQAPSPSERRGDPRVAALLTWFLPGAGHLYLGMPLFGLGAFLVVDGLYVLGLWLSNGMLFEYLEKDLQGPLAGALTPEAGNLGLLVYHMRRFGFGPDLPRVWPAAMHLGTWLTAVSGFVNACLIVRVWLDATAPRGRPTAARSTATRVLAAWLVPGLGHLLQGRRLRALIVCAALLGLLALGTVLCDGSNLDRERHFYYWAGQFLLGAPVMLLELVRGHPPVTRELPYVDCGLGMACVAGLLNVLAMIDVANHDEQVAGAAVPAAAASDAPNAPIGASPPAKAGAAGRPQPGTLA